MSLASLIFEPDLGLRQMSTQNTARPDLAPEWAKSTTWKYIQQLHKLSQLSHVAKAGLTHMSQMPDIVKVLIDLNVYPAAETADKALLQAQSDAKVAQEESTAGFALIHAQIAILMWSYLEGLCRNLVTEWIKNIPTVRESPAISSLKVRLVEFETLDFEERNYYIFDLLEQSLSSSIKHGINRFESLFEVCGLSGTTPEHISRDLFELQQVRHVLVHRAGVVDRRFAKACPWLNKKFGEEVKLSSEDIDRYFYATNGYIVILLARVGTYFGQDMSESINGGPYAHPRPAARQ